MEWHEETFGRLVRGFAIDFRLLAAERVALQNATLRSLDTALAAPAKTVARGDAAHLAGWMMDPAAVAEKCLGHVASLDERGFRGDEHAAESLQENDGTVCHRTDIWPTYTGTTIFARQARR